MVLAAVAIDQVARDPSWHPLRLSQDFRSLTCVRLNRTDLNQVVYLEERFIPASAERVEVPLDAIASAVRDVAHVQPRLAFHSSMAASTLLARMFDLPGRSMALSEPIILNQLSAARSRGEDVRQPLAIIVGLLSRPFADGELTVVKPGNSANNLMPLIGHEFPNLRALTLESPVRDFLRSVAKRGSAGRMIYRRLYAFVSRTKSLPTGMTQEDLWEMTDLQVAGMAWLLQHSEFVDMLRIRPNQFRSLESNDFVALQPPLLTALGEHFKIPLSSDRADYGEVFNRHSKDRSRPFDASDRQRELDQVGQTHVEEIESAALFVEAMAKRTGVPLTLPNPLVAMAAR